MSAGAALRALALVFLAALLQVGIVASLVVAGGAPDLMLVLVVVLALERGSLPGAALGFVGGLVADVLTLDTLGLSSLVLTLAGFWAGRYGETTARSRRLAPLLAVGAITVLATVLALVLRYLLGEEVAAGHALGTALGPALALNLLLALPVLRLVRKVVGEPAPVEPVTEVELVV